MGLQYLLFQIIVATSECSLMSIFHTHSSPHPLPCSGFG